MTAAYQIRQCNEYGKLGMMGVTILYSSGDDGVAGFGGLCIDPATGEKYCNSLGGKLDSLVW
jgi:tripeptidyl-peptidase I